MTIDTVLFDMGGTIEDIHFDRALRLKALPGILALLAGEGILLSGTDQEILGKLLSRNAEYKAWSEKAKIESPPETIWNGVEPEGLFSSGRQGGQNRRKPRLSVGNQFFHQEDETRGSFHPRGPGGKGIQARRHKQYIEQDPGFQDPRGIRHSEVLRVRDPFQRRGDPKAPSSDFRGGAQGDGLGGLVYRLCRRHPLERRAWLEESGVRLGLPDPLIYDGGSDSLVASGSVQPDFIVEHLGEVVAILDNLRERSSGQ